MCRVINQPVRYCGHPSFLGGELLGVALLGIIGVMKKPIHNRKYLEKFRKDLRNNLTSAEAYLWRELQGRKFEGRKFRRQHSINNFIVDFYCPAEQLIIELDGMVHFNPEAQEKDRKRDAILKEMGFKIMRFENRMVFEHLETVLKEIKENFQHSGR